MTTSSFQTARMKLKPTDDGRRIVPPIRIYREGTETFELADSNPDSTSPSFPASPGRPFFATPCTSGPITTAFLCFSRNSIPEWHQAFHDHAVVTIQMRILSGGVFVKDELLTVELECYENPLPAVAAYIQDVKEASTELIVAFTGFLSALFRFPWGNRAQKLREEPSQAIDILPDAVGPVQAKALIP